MGRDKAEWKLEKREMKLYLASKEGEAEFSGENETPEDMYTAVRLKFNLQALELLLEGDKPIRISYRVKKTG